MIIVIDGPAGSGKSTTARAVADRLEIEYLDSGALYRALTLLYIEAGSERKAFFELLNHSTIDFRYIDGRFEVSIDGQDVTSDLRSMKVSDLVSQVASLPRAREEVNGLMKKAVADRVCIAEGRDLGTAVFPEAELKFFMSASVEERARRRYQQMKQAGSEVTLDQIRRNIEERDRRDTERDADPLYKADDAIEIDTTNLSFEQQVSQICSVIEDTLQNKTN